MKIYRYQFLTPERKPYQIDFSVCNTTNKTTMEVPEILTLCKHRHLSVIFLKPASMLPFDVRTNKRPILIIYEGHASLLLEGKYLFDSFGLLAAPFFGLIPIQLYTIQGLNEENCVHYVLHFYDCYIQYGLQQTVHYFNSRIHGKFSIQLGVLLGLSSV